MFSVPFSNSENNGIRSFDSTVLDLVFSWIDFDMVQYQMRPDCARSGICRDDVMRSRNGLPCFYFQLGPEVVRRNHGIGVIKNDPVHMLVNILALLRHPVVIQQLGKDVIGSRVDVFSLIRLHRFAILRFAHGPTHERAIVSVDRFEDLLDPILRDERLFADRKQIPKGVELVGPDISIFLSGLGVKTGNVILKLLALLVLSIPPQFIESYPALVECLLEVFLAGLVADHIGTV